LLFLPAVCRVFFKIKCWDLAKGEYFFSLKCRQKNFYWSILENVSK
jgi:hypothetical protein